MESNVNLLPVAAEPFLEKYLGYRIARRADDMEPMVPIAEALDKMLTKYGVWVEVNMTPTGTPDRHKWSFKVWSEQTFWRTDGVVYGSK